MGGIVELAAGKPTRSLQRLQLLSWALVGGNAWSSNQGLGEVRTKWLIRLQGYIMGDRLLVRLTLGSMSLAFAPACRDLAELRCLTLHSRFHF